MRTARSRRLRASPPRAVLADGEGHGCLRPLTAILADGATIWTSAILRSSSPEFAASSFAAERAKFSAKKAAGVEWRAPSIQSQHDWRREEHRCERAPSMRGSRGAGQQARWWRGRRARLLGSIREFRPPAPAQRFGPVPDTGGDAVAAAVAAAGSADNLSVAVAAVVTNLVVVAVAAVVAVAVAAAAAAVAVVTNLVLFLSLAASLKGRHSDDLRFATHGDEDKREHHAEREGDRGDIVRIFQCGEDQPVECDR